MIPRSLQGRLLLTYSGLMVLGLGGLIVWTGLRLQAAAIEQTENEMELQAVIIATAVSEPLGRWRQGEALERRVLESIVLASARNVEGTVTVLGPDLEFFLSSDEEEREHFLKDERDEDDDKNKEDHPELAAARSGLERHDIRLDKQQREELMFVAVPIVSDDGNMEGVIQLSSPTAPVHAGIRRMWAGLIAAGAVVLAATISVSVLLARQMIGPIRRLTRVTERVAAGDVAQRVDASGPEELTRLGHAFNRMAEQVQEMLARQQALVADAAHELRTPLTGIQLRIEMLQRHGGNRDELEPRYLTQLQKEADHLQRVIGHLLALSTLDQGEEPPRSPLDLAPLLYEMSDDMEPLFRNADVRLHIEVPPHLPLVMGNSEALGTVVRNLLDNAIQYTPPGGSITIKAETVNNRVRLSVTDTGQGIGPEHLPKIFDRFYRVDRARSRRAGGAGLGLALVRGIAEAHGGSVTVESVEAEGTTFTVDLPVHSGNGAGAGPA